MKRVLFIAVGVVLGCAACAEETNDLGGEPIDKDAIRRKLQQAKAVEQETKAAKPQFSYNPVGKRDPFRSYLAEMAKKSLERKAPRLSATEQYELDQYRLTGLVTGTSQPKAMVEDPGGVGHALRVGSRIGKNRGRVTRITNSFMIVTEEFVDAQDEKHRVNIKVALPSSEDLLFGR